MTEPDKDTEALIERMRTRTGSEVVVAGAITLLNLIPFAGGAVASVIGEFASQRKLEKVCDVLSNLQETLESQKADPEEHLSKDQIVEVVHETLQTAATTSDDKKLDALKRGLGYAFLADDLFERKQVFLQVLRGATALELAVLQKVYEVRDPYLFEEGGPSSALLGSAPLSPLIAGGVTVSAQPVRSLLTAGSTYGVWQPIKNEEQGVGTLLSFMARWTELDEGMVEGVLRLLDSKGLTSAITNLQRTDSKVVKWNPLGELFTGASDAVLSGYFAFVTSTTPTRPTNVVRPSPLEATRTTFGTEFLRIFKSG